MNHYETIAAICTAIGTGGISVIRISGENAFYIADQVFQAKKADTVSGMKSHTVAFGNIIDRRADQILDEVLVTKFEAPHSFTGEDTVEISCHGGLLLTKMILDLILSAGARLAQPGEFSKRAFLNGKMDLSKAEAVIEMIHAKSENNIYNNAFLMAGGLLEPVNEVRRRLIDLTASILAKVEFPEEDIDEVFTEDVVRELGDCQKQLESLRDSYQTGKILSQGIKVAIAGRPNVGKSSLLNAFLKENRAIVTEIAGTTRDTLEEYATIRGVLFRFIDTAGIRETEDVIEKIGVERARQAVLEADFVLFLQDGSQERGMGDRQVEALLAGKKVLSVFTKIDLGRIRNEQGIFISAKTGEGMENLIDALFSMAEFRGERVGHEPLITSLRQKESIDHALFALEQAISAARQQTDLDLVTIDMQQAVMDLGEVTGKTVSEEVIDTIFARFCLGK